mgnify:CR=1 FL=1
MNFSKSDNLPIRELCSLYAPDQNDFENLLSMKNILLGIACFCMAMAANSQTVAPALLQKQWDASWITVPDVPAHEYQVFLFRKTLDLPRAPANYLIHVSADNRYKLFVNGQLASLGPARGDLSHWNFETVDLAPYLKTGQNVLAAQVWNETEWRPEAQISLRTGFILQGASAAEAAANTNDTWRCLRDESYQPLKVQMRTYYVTGPGEYVDMARHASNWAAPDYQDTGWLNARTLFKGVPKNVMGPYGTPSGWMLVPSTLPQLERRQERFQKVLQVEGFSVPASFPQEKTSLTVPANTTVTLLLDQGYLTNAYPTLQFSGGKNATLSIGYAEALFSKYPEKGNRNETAGKQLIGRKDSLLSDGSRAQVFTPLNFRTYRFVKITIKTLREPLVLDDVSGTFTGYPFQKNAVFDCPGNPEMKQMLEIGWRTARLCAVETYMDCPYYEQLQYIGDARIQALVSLYNSGDDRLLRNALNQMDQSRQPEGVTLSRHPSYTPQYIPTFSLWYIGMLHDYARYGKDPGFVRDKLPGVRQILGYFQKYQQPDGSLKGVPQWMFTDWVEEKGWNSGTAPMGEDGTSALPDLQLLWAYQLAADLEKHMGMQAYAEQYAENAGQLKKTIQARYWDAERRLYADRPEKDLYSQHAGGLAILTGMVEGDAARQLAGHIRDDNSLAPASIYFRYYLHQAWTKAGLGNDYLKWLDKWRENIAMGLTTWAEISEISRARSDCHAWGASPNIEFYRTILGVDSDGWGFSKVKIEPHLGSITDISGSIPHPGGPLKVSYRLENGAWNIEIDLPPGVSGTLFWKGENISLQAGKNSFKK